MEEITTFSLDLAKNVFPFHESDSDRREIPCQPGSCSPDNASCEALLGRLIPELFYPHDWKTTTIEQLIKEVDG